MYLTKEEEKMLESDNPAVSKAMEILVALGDIFGAEKLIKIKSAHVSGISYQNIGNEGLEWIEKLNAKVKVKTTINPAGMDLEKWKEMEIDEEFYSKQIRIINAFKRLGAEITLTCTPYLQYTPKHGDILSWSESSAIIYANSVLGAKTNRESGISALAAAIIGKTPYYGLLIDENRKPSIIVEYDGEINYRTLSLVGLKLGEILERNKIPLFKFQRKLKKDEMKILGASLASTSDLAIFHILDQTPEARIEKPLEKITIEIEKDETECDPDLIALGCPHLSENELKGIFEIIKKEGKVKREIILFTSRYVAKKNKKLIEKFEKNKVKVFTDTCIVVSPLAERFGTILVDSGKAFTYLPKLRKVRTCLASTICCIRKAYE